MAILREAVIVDAVRSPVGRRNGQLKDWHPVDLLAQTLSALIERFTAVTDDASDSNAFGAHVLAQIRDEAECPFYLQVTMYCRVSRIFEAFQKLEHAATRDYKSTQIVTDDDGERWAISQAQRLD